MSIMAPIVPIDTPHGSGERWIAGHRTAHRWICATLALACLVLEVVVVVTALTDPTYDGSGIVFWLLAAIPLVLWAGPRACSFTIDVDADGVTYHGAVRDRGWQWWQVRRFSVERLPTGQGSNLRLAAMCGDSKPKPVSGRSMGNWPMAADELDDIASWLNSWRP